MTQPSLFAPAAPEARPYQKRDIAAVLAALSRGEDPCRQLPTGGGKTFEASSVIAATLGNGWEWGIFVHRVELLRQMSRALRRMGVDHGIVGQPVEVTYDDGTTRRYDGQLSSHRVHVASIDTVRARMKQPEIASWLKRIRSLTDECHHAVANSWDQVLQQTRQRVGYTATPCRTDGRGLGETGLFNRLIKGPSIAELTAAGYLCEAHYYNPPGFDRSKLAKRGGDFVLGQAAAAADTDILTAGAVRWYNRVSGPVIMACGNPPPAVAFCTTVEHAEHVAAAFRRHGVLAASVDGSMRGDERDSTINGLADGSVQVLTSCALIGEGLDIPAVAAALLLRPTASTALFLQQIGRALRPHPDKSHATIVDLVGNVGDHGMYDAQRQWDLKSGLKGLERAVAGTWRCRKCHRVYTRPDESTVMRCSCGVEQKASGFASPKLDNMPPIAGIPAEKILRMPWNDAVKACKTREDLLAFAAAREAAGKPISNANAWARMVLERRNAMKARFQPRFRAGGFR